MRSRRRWNLGPPGARFRGRSRTRLGSERRRRGRSTPDAADRTVRRVRPGRWLRERVVLRCRGRRYRPPVASATTSEESTSRCNRSSGSPDASDEASASTVARSTPPGNGAIAHSSRRSASSRSRYDESIVARSVRCRSSSRPSRPVARSSARLSRSRTACIGITATWRAASSMPSGSPSSRCSTSTRSAASSSASS